jgi:RNA polymerase sigma-70 factor (ECF subfamily)
MREDLTDELLMHRIACGDAAAFDVLFLRYRRAIFHYTLRMVTESTLAEDLTQECFLRVWRSRHQYRLGAPFRTWLFTIARRIALDEVKKRRVPTTALAADTEEGSDSRVRAEQLTDPSHEDPAEIAVSRELTRVIEGALNHLPETLREVVLLRDRENMTYEEIAQITGCPLGTVKSRLNAARARLRAVALEWLNAR